LTPEEDIVLTPNQERIFSYLKEQRKDNPRLRKYSLRFWKEKISKMGEMNMARVLNDDVNEILGNHWFYQKMEDGDVVVQFVSKITKRDDRFYGAEVLINGLPGKYSFGDSDNWLIKSMVFAMKKHDMKNDDLPGTIWTIQKIGEYNDNIDEWHIEYVKKM
jgi:hypothetical protein